MSSYQPQRLPRINEIPPVFFKERAGPYDLSSPSTERVEINKQRRKEAELRRLAKTLQDHL